MVRSPVSVYRSLPAARIDSLRNVIFGYFRHLEEIRTAQMVVALLNRSVDRSYVDRELERRVAEIGFCTDDGHVECVKCAGDFGNAEMSDHKSDSRMRRIAFPSGLGKRRHLRYGGNE